MGSESCAVARQAYDPLMVTLAQVLAFLLAAVLITVAPGPDNLMVLGMGMSKGRRQGIAFGLGCALGCLSHTALAVMGVSAIVAASPTAFAALKWIGGAYLIWLGVNALRTAGNTAKLTGSGPEQASLLDLFLKGILANAINPKVVLFFLSFLPQFVVPAQEGIALQLGILGLVFTIQAAVLFGLLGYFAGTIGAWLKRQPRAGAWLDRVAGAVFVGLGLRMVVSR
jgi:threonine/homoserine/homoserine lactone efflux protein